VGVISQSAGRAGHVRETAQAGQLAGEPGAGADQSDRRVGAQGAFQRPGVGVLGMRVPFLWATSSVR